MNFEIILRYSLEISMIIPAIIFAVVPVAEYLKINSLHSFLTALFLILISVIAAAFSGARYEIRISSILIPFAIILFLLYFMTVKLETGKKLFCLFNSFILCELCPMFTILFMARNEFSNELFYKLDLFTLKSGLVCLCIAVFLGIISFKALTKKIPVLLREEQINSLWNYLYIIPLGIAVLIHWSRPKIPAVVMTGRVRNVTIGLMIFITVTTLLLIHIFWWITSKLTENAKLQQENNLLQMEGKRYKELRNYMEKTKTLRHDFRQHILVISELLKSGRLSELENYISQFNDETVMKYSNYCSNNAVDAIASYYDGIASSQNTKISWSLELPSKLPIKDSDYCPMLGNLLENSLKAVKNLPVEERKVKINSSMLSDLMLGISIDNPFEGEILFAKNGFPVSKQEGHGLGLISVSNTVERYGGNLKIKAEKKIFSADVILYCSNINTENNFSR